MSALGRFGRFTLFSPRVSHSKYLPCSFCFVLCFGFGGLLLCCVFGFLFSKCFGIPNSQRSLDLDDRQGLIASSAMQQKKKIPVGAIGEAYPSGQLLYCWASKPSPFQIGDLLLECHLVAVQSLAERTETRHSSSEQS